MAMEYQMPGTSSGSIYTAVASTDMARIGLRSNGKCISIRIEPLKKEPAFLEKMKKALPGWATPQGDNCRFSKHVTHAEFEKTFIAGLKAIAGHALEINPSVEEQIITLAKKYAKPKKEEKEVFAQTSKELYSKLKEKRS